MPDDPTLTPKPDEPLGVDVTTRKCPACGEGYTGESHANCPSTAGGTLKKAPGAGSSKSRIDDVPQEAAAYVDDPGRQLGQYVLVKQIGKGGMGAVWKAWDKKLTRWVAIKFLLVSEEEDVLRFQREAKLAARLRHPNIAPIYEVGEAPAMQAGQSTRHFLAMEYIDGTSLASAINFPIPELLDIFVKVAQGVEAAHKAGVVHRDLKPQNVMLTSDKWPYVMDFGLAKALQAESSISVSGAVMGTPAYMPPEQAQGQLDQIDAQSDVYSLGATMYAVLCKKQPFQGQTPMEILMKVCKEDPVAPRKHNPEIPAPVETIILKALAKEKADRYASSAALAEDLKRVLSNQEIAAQGPSSVKLAARKLKRNLWPVLAVAALLVAGGVVAFTMLGKKPEPPPAVKIPEPPPDLAVKPPDPVVKPPDPVPDPAVLALKKEQEWVRTWLEVRRRLDFDDWKADDAALPESARKQLATVATDAPTREQDVTDFLTAQIERADSRLKGLAGTLDERKAGASRVLGWCDALLAALKDAAMFKGRSDEAGRVRAAASKIVSDRGMFSLQVLVGPDAELTKLTKDGAAFPLPAVAASPFRMDRLEIADYELEFTSKSHGKKTEKVLAAQLKDGMVWMLSGHMRNPKLLGRPQP
jgi:serine/threonine protein kinase